MSKPKRIDADHLIRQYYEGEDMGQQGAFPEDTLESVPRVDPPSSDEMTPDVTLSGGDIDATWSGTDDGEEAVGGSTPTPDQDVVDELGKAAGVTYEDNEPLRFGDKVADRDAQRWELNPASSEGYQERVQELTSRETSTPKGQQTKRLKQAARIDQGASSRTKAGAGKAPKKKR
ncbi:MAG: hypothetical protein JSS39_16010 [Nitrospira sp.]|nr:hypothetical protein [Nitrospira sp.]